MSAGQPDRVDSSLTPVAGRPGWAVIDIRHAATEAELGSSAALINGERYAEATTQAILDVVSSVRNNQPLVK